MRRLASLSFLFVLATSLEPLARSEFDASSCCCPDTFAQCPLRGDTCASQSHCESDRQVTLESRSLYLLPPDADLLRELSHVRFGARFVSRAVALGLAVPDPPPRA